jgi:hypothetical protein
MKKIKATLLVFLIISTMPAWTAEDENVIVGTWKLVRFENFDEGVSSHPFGEKPIGYFIYTQDGFVSIHIQTEEQPEHWAPLRVPPDDGGPDPWYVGYFGRYSVDFDAGTVTHHVEGGTILGYPGTEQERPFVLDGDRLVIGVKNEWERELHRVR